MAKVPPNSGKAWTKEKTRELRELVEHNTPTRLIGLKTGRSENAVYSKASALGLSIKPTNQSPYGRRKR